MKRLGLGLLGALVLASCAPQQDISFTVDRSARILGTHDGLTEVGLTGYVWCSQPSVGIDLDVRIRQDGTSRSTSQTISCQSTEPQQFSSTVRFDGDFPEPGSARIRVEGSTDEEGSNDSEVFQGPIDLT